MKFLIFIGLGFFSMTLLSDQIRVLSGGAAKSFIEPLAASFPGHQLAQGSGKPIARVGIGVAVHESAPLPDQISEILPLKGVKLAGSVPPELQKYTVYVAVPIPAGAKSQVVNAFITHLTGPGARERLAQAGYTSPE